MRLAILAMTFAATAAQAQGIEDLPDRPIARTEVQAVVKRQFAAMDTKRDGSVTPAEFESYRARTAGSQSGSDLAAFDRLGPNWFARADRDGDGRVTFAEAEARPMQFFDIADTDGDGIVSQSERQVAALIMALGGR